MVASRRQPVALVACGLTWDEDGADGGEPPVERQHLHPRRARVERTLVPLFEARKLRIRRSGDDEPGGRVVVPVEPLHAEHAARLQDASERLGGQAAAHDRCFRDAQARVDLGHRVAASSPRAAPRTGRRPRVGERIGEQIVRAKEGKRVLDRGSDRLAQLRDDVVDGARAVEERQQMRYEPLGRGALEFEDRAGVAQNGAAALDREAVPRLQQRPLHGLHPATASCSSNRSSTG